MPRSVNAVAARARRKKILSRTRGYFLARRNVWTVAKNAYEKALGYAYRDRKNKKREFRGFNVSTQQLVFMECLIQFLWVKFIKMKSN